jgi:hypothetical protein
MDTIESIPQINVSVRLDCFIIVVPLRPHYSHLLLACFLPFEIDWNVRFMNLQAESQPLLPVNVCVPVGLASLVVHLQHTYPSPWHPVYVSFL